MTYKTIIDELIQELKNKIINGDHIDLSIIKTIIEPNEDNSKLFNFLKEQKLMSQPDINKMISNKIYEQKMMKELGGIPQSKYDLVRLYMEKYDIDVSIDGKFTVNKLFIKNDKGEIQFLTPEDYKNNIILMTAKSQTKINDIRDIERRIRLLVSDNNLKERFTNIDINDALTEYVNRVKEKNSLELKYTVGLEKDVIAEREAKDIWNKVISNTFRIKDGELDFTVAIFKKFIWQIKRKMMDNPNYPVTDHLMPVLFGPQKKGKSTFIEKLIGPIKKLSVEKNFNEIQDDREIDMWKNYVINMSEMGKADRADMDIIKHLITTPTINRRPMRTNESITIPQNATFIGSTNNPLKRVIKDSTGMRRFIEVTISTNSKLDIILNTDYLTLWRSVDPLSEDPMKPYQDILDIKQSELRQIERVEDFFANFNPDEIYNDHEKNFKDYSFGKNNNRITRENLYKVFKTFEKEFYPTTYKMSMIDFYIEHGRLSGSEGMNFTLNKIRSKSGIIFEYQDLTNDE